MQRSTVYVDGGTKSEAVSDYQEQGVHLYIHTINERVQVEDNKI